MQSWDPGLSSFTKVQQHGSMAMGVRPLSSILMGESIQLLGYPHWWKPPYLDIQILGLCVCVSTHRLRDSGKASCLLHIEAFLKWGRVYPIASSMFIGFSITKPSLVCYLSSLKLLHHSSTPRMRQCCHGSMWSWIFSLSGIFSISATSALAVADRQACGEAMTSHVTTLSWYEY